MTQRTIELSHWPDADGTDYWFRKKDLQHIQSVIRELYPDESVVPLTAIDSILKFVEYGYTIRKEKLRGV